MNFADAFSFLKKLAKNNNRDWFEKNKPQFLAIKESFEAFVADIHQDMIEFEPEMAGLDPKKFVFRIYRDVRFSKDKRPYKKFISAGFSPKGKGTGVPGYYLQLEPGDRSFLCCGLYAPPPEDLGKIRQEIDYNGEELIKITSEKKFRQHYTLWEEDALKSAPKGYEKDHPYINWIRLKSFVVMNSLSDKQVLSGNFRKQLITAMKAGKPFNSFFRHALE